MINEKRYVLVHVTDVTEAMRQNTIPYGVNYVPTIVEIDDIEYELLKWRGDKPAELWQEFPVYTNTEMSDYIATRATLSQPPQPV